MKGTNKTKKGSTLVMVLLIVAIMTTLGATVLQLAYQSYRGSLVMRNNDKAYGAAEAAVYQVAKVLDEKVAVAQEAARLNANEQLKLLLEPIETSPIRNPDGSVNLELAKILYRTKYLEAFDSILNSPSSFFTNISTQQSLNALMNTDLNSLEAAMFLDTNKRNKAILCSAQYDQGNKVVYIVTEGSHVSSLTQKERLEVGFSLLPDPQNIPYQIIPKMVVVRPVLPKVLKKVILTEKNLVSAGGTVNITGDVLSFGTIPALNGEEDQSAEGYKYGGIIAGIPSLENLYFGGQSFDSYFDFDTSKLGTALSGSFNFLKDEAKGINGNVATMGYLHTMFSSNDLPSQVSAQGKVFARAIKAEELATSSKLTLGDTYLSDNLQVDADDASISVNGTFYGFVTASYDIDGSGRLGGSEKDNYEYKRTSSIVVNGDSTINLNGTSTGGVYIGGSTFFGNLLAKDVYPTEKRPFMTGISALKAGTRIPFAFEEQNAVNGETRLYTSSSQYLLGPNFSLKAYNDVTDPMDIVSLNMLNGVSGSFTLSDRAKHFKGLWDNVWDLDDLYSLTLDTGAINIAVDSDGKINGFAYGDIVSNGKVYGQEDMKGSIDASNFGLLQKGSEGTKGVIEEFHENLSPLLLENYDRTKPKLDYISNSKHISDYLNLSISKVYSVPKLIYTNGTDQGIVYYKEGDCNITLSGGSYLIDGKPLALLRGIIIATGNIYIENGFNFSGALLSTKNIIFKGSSSINYDGELIKNMLLDVELSNFFKQVRYVTDATSINGQRISRKNLKIVKWTKENSN